MGGGKLPPRQKMIGMMYLVLTALLAMNVSKDILNAFIVINEGLHQTNTNFEDKNNNTLKIFEAVAAKDPKAGPYLERAKKAQKLAHELSIYIDNLKKLVIKETEKCDDKAADTLYVKMRSIGSKDNYDEPTRVLIGPEPATPITGPNTANELKSKIDGLKNELVKLLDNGPGVVLLDRDKKPVVESVKKLLNTEIAVVENGVKEDWINLNFYHLPLAAVITNLSKLQTDVNNAEADVIKALYSGVGSNDVKFDSFKAQVIAKSSYVFAGEEYEADVLLSASSSSQKLTILTGAVDTSKRTLNGEGKPLEVVAGLGKYKVGASGEGLQKWGGIIILEKPDGTKENFPFTAEYMVAKPAAAVSADKMNVFYIGVDNPVTISAAGVSPENLQPSLSGQGSLSGSKGKYNVKVNGGTECTINVNAKFANGNKNMGSSKFRVKRLPDPYAFVMGKRGDVIMSKGELGAAGAVIAKFENFDFDLPVVVSSFNMSISVKGILSEMQSSSKSFTPEMLAKIASAPPGTKVYIENIKAKLPDGGPARSLPGINIKLK
jgi:gliding motility-associated protein GldM